MFLFTFSSILCNIKFGWKIYYLNIDFNNICLTERGLVYLYF